MHDLPDVRLIVFLVLLVAPPLAQAQHHGGAQSAPTATDSLRPSDYAVYRTGGAPAALDDVAEAMDTARVVFVGERHDDRTAHALQLRLLRRLQEQAPERAALSLEMLARDVQPVVDEYLDSLITERHFLRASRPWPNYRRDYHPLVRFTRSRGLPVLAANAPRRYVNRVSRLGRAALRDLPERALQWLPPLPYPQPSDAYRRRFRERMQQAAAHHGSDGEGAHGGGGGPSMKKLLDAQALWDATMGYALADFLTRRPDARVLHVAGGFHVERGLGTPAMLRRYRPGTPVLTVTMRPAGDVDAWSDEYDGLADFVVLTRTSKPTEGTE